MLHFMLFKWKKGKEEPHFPKVSGHLLKEKEEGERGWERLEINKISGQSEENGNIQLYLLIRAELRKEIMVQKETLKRKAS